MPTVFHITHHKAGSQWIKSILRDAAPERFVPAQRQVAHVVNQPIQQGKVYPTVYLTRQRFEQLHIPGEHRKFIIFRDLRDTVVSLYFGLKVHHHLFRKDQFEARERLNNCNTEAGLIFLIGERLVKSADIQQSWLDSGELIVRYEELIRDQVSMSERILAHCQLHLPSERLNAIVAAREFRNVSGRKPGEEHLRSHHRKGIAGDWRTHFTPAVTNAFKGRFGQLLIDTGYERDTNWHAT